MHRFLSIFRSRLPVLLAVAAIVIALLVGTHLRGSLSGAWQMLHVPALSLSFADTRTITHAIDCLRSGQNPYTDAVRNFDPWHRDFYQPPIWLALRDLGVTSRSTNLIGTLIAAITVAAFMVLFRAKTWVGAVVIFLAVISRPVLFVVNRGNMDQLIFSLLVIGLFLIDRQKPAVRSLLQGALIALLTVLKIFPVAAVVVLLRSRKGILAAALTTILSVAALVATTGRLLPHILAVMEQSLWGSFGSLLFFIALFTPVSHLPASHLLLSLAQHHPKGVSLAALLLGVLSLLAAVAWRQKLNRLFPPLDFNQTRGNLAAAGLAIFCLAFLRGSSYNYRLIFLLCPIAYLVDDFNPARPLRSLPAATLLLALLWKPYHLSLPFEIIDGLVYIASCAWLGTSLLDRLQPGGNARPHPSATAAPSAPEAPPARATSAPHLAP